MKFGFSIPVPTPRLDYMFDGTKKAEACGFYSVFYADHTVMLPPGPGTCFDAFMFLTSLAMITKKLKFCTGVSDCHRFHPALMAQKVATLDNISNGRAMLGIGAGEAMNIDMYGLKRDKAVSKIREYIDLIRKFWTKRKVTYDSGFWGKMKKAWIQIKPVQEMPPIYIAANGPKMRKLTGELGDGWYPITEAPWTYKEHCQEIVAGAKAVGREPSKIDFVYDCFVAIDDENPENAIKRCEFFKTSCLLYPEKMNKMYSSMNLPTDLTLHNFEMDSNGATELMNCADQIPNSFLQDTNCLGTTDDVIASIEKFKEAGATHMVLMNRVQMLIKFMKYLEIKLSPTLKNQIIKF
ncbi:MAG: LLM class flavin-dependent oxidoreductase [Promethearchaeota archaeon]